MDAVHSLTSEELSCILTFKNLRVYRSYPQGRRHFCIAVKQICVKTTEFDIWTP